MTAKFYEVGGYVRDSLMGARSKDRDYSVEADSFDAMRQAIKDRKGEIYLETPEYFTIRANIPKLGAADFVLCRKDGVYTDGRRPDTVEMGTIYDDLARRDFTMNAIARDEEGVLLDPHEGQKDIQRRLIKAVGSAHKRFAEDSLRMLRAVRFSITKTMKMDEEILSCFKDEQLLDLLGNVSPERIREELLKCFKCNTVESLVIFETFPGLRKKIFREQTGIWLKPTMEE